VAAVLSGAALFLAQANLPKPVDPPFTQFYMAGAWEHTRSIADVAPGHVLAVTVGIANQTHRTQQYHITPWIDQAASWPVREVRVGAGQRWVGSVRGTVPADGCLHRLDIALSTGKNSMAVSSLVLWVRGSAGAQFSCAPAHG
jgi:uncharacterized membrane protein